MSGIQEKYAHVLISGRLQAENDDDNRRPLHQQTSDELFRTHLEKNASLRANMTSKTISEATIKLQEFIKLRQVG